MEIQETESNQTTDWTASILSSSTVTCTHPYTLYEIQVTSPSTPSTVIRRRFRQFFALHTALANMDKTLPPFPIPKVYYKMNPKVVQEREYELQSYLRLLLTRPQLFHSFRMKLFLGLIPMEGRTCIITGSNSGIGLETARALAWLGMHVVMACRSEEKTLSVIESIKEETRNANIEFMYLNLASLVSVRDFVENFKAKGRPLHLLVNNAGCLAEQGVTDDGFETTFGVNYLGHFLLTLLLVDLLCKTVTSRIVFVCDEYIKVRPISEEKVREPASLIGVFEAYELSKQACLFFANELTHRLEHVGVAVFSAFPGGSATNLFRRLPVFMDWILKKFVGSEEEGALPVIFCAISKELEGRTGVCISSTCHEKPHDSLLLDLEVGTTLWRLSQSWISEVYRENNLESEFLFKTDKQDPFILGINSKEDVTPLKKILAQPPKIGLLGIRNVANVDSDSEGYGEYGVYG